MVGLGVCLTSDAGQEGQWRDFPKFNSKHLHKPFLFYPYMWVTIFLLFHKEFKHFISVQAPSGCHQISHLFIFQYQNSSALLSLAPFSSTEVWKLTFSHDLWGVYPHVTWMTFLTCVTWRNDAVNFTSHVSMLCHARHNYLSSHWELLLIDPNNICFDLITISFWPN